MCPAPQSPSSKHQEIDDQDKAMSEWKRRVSVDSHIPKEGVIVMNRVFVKGIPKKAMFNDVFDAFSRFGTVTDVNIIHDEHGYSKGFGFITFENTSSALKALDHDKPLKINGIAVGTVAPAIKKSDNVRHHPTRFPTSPPNNLFQPPTFYVPFSSAATSTPTTTSPVITIQQPTPTQAPFVQFQPPPPPQFIMSHPPPQQFYYYQQQPSAGFFADPSTSATTPQLPY